MPKFNLDKVEFEPVTVTYKGKNYELLPMTAEINNKLLPLEKKIKNKKGDFNVLVERLMVMTTIPREVLESMTMQQMNCINDFYLEAAIMGKKKESEDQKSN